MILERVLKVWIQMLNLNINSPNLYQKTTNRSYFYQK
jgi:hypothetical protein